MKKVMKKGETCNCHGSHMFLGYALLAIGVFIAVVGFARQLDNELNYMSLVWYFVGFLVMGFGKTYKHRGCKNCPVHKI